LLISCVCSLGIAYAQDVSLAPRLERPSGATVLPSKIDSVQLTDGNLHIEIPLWRTAGRGIDDYAKLVFDSNSWEQVTTCDGDNNCAILAQPRTGAHAKLEAVGPISYVLSDVATPVANCPRGHFINGSSY
jgi:hypothetical protein